MTVLPTAPGPDGIWDAVVAGAGPAGSVAAFGLARGGASVLLVDRRPFPRWKVCGACIGPTAQAALRSVGLHPPALSRGVPLDRLSLSAFGRRAEIPLEGNVALSRREFDQALVDEAVAAGAAFTSGVRAAMERRSRSSATDTDAGTASVTLTPGTGGATAVVARVVIDATGLGGALEQGTDARATVASDARLGLGAVFVDPDRALAVGELQMIIGRGGYAGLVRLEDGTIDVGAAVDARLVAEHGAAGAVANILAEAGAPPLSGELVEGWKGTPALTRASPQLAGRRLFRVGDAAGYVEPFTGEGMGWAIGSSAAVLPFALRAITSWDDGLARDWERDCRHRLTSSQRTCSIVARGLRMPGLVRSAVGLLGPFPGLAAPLVRATGRVATS